MSAPVRVSAVSFLNARPLASGLEAERTLFDIEFDLNLFKSILRTFTRPPSFDFVIRFIHGM